MPRPRVTSRAKKGSLENSTGAYNLACGYEALDKNTEGRFNTASGAEALTSATLTGSDTATVEVIDNTTGAKLLSCTVNSTSKNNCSNNAETGSAAAGNKLEVKITTSGKSGASKDWEVTFRY